MRKPLLLAILGLVTFSLIGCGDASSSTGVARSRGAKAPVEGTTPDDDGTIADEPDDPANPNSDKPPAPPGTPGTTTGALGVTLSTATPATDLGTTVDITVSVEPKAGITGSAALSVTGLPTGATSVFTPASVTLGTAVVTSKLSVTVPFTATPSAPNTFSAIIVKAVAGTAEATANANFKVNPKLTMTIPVNSTALFQAGGTKFVDGWGSPIFGTAPANLTTQPGNGITIVVVNADSVPRTVHGNGAFLHGGAAQVLPGAIDPRVRVLDPTAAQPAAGNGYIHAVNNVPANNTGTSVAFRITVAAAP